MLKIKTSTADAMNKRLRQTLGAGVSVGVVVELVIVVRVKYVLQTYKKESVCGTYGQ
jgi:hypothetical protein